MMPNDRTTAARWSVYLLRCGNGALYTGIATDVSRRLVEHREAKGKGAKYLRGKGPLRLVFKKAIGARSLALSVEGFIKKLSKARKEALIARDDVTEQMIAQALKMSNRRAKRSAVRGSSSDDGAVEVLTLREARRLALARAGLLKPEWTGFPRRSNGCGKRARDAAAAVIRRFGYLQLDTVSIAGARSHTIVLLCPALRVLGPRGELDSPRTLSCVRVSPTRIPSSPLVGRHRGRAPRRRTEAPSPYPR